MWFAVFCYAKGHISKLFWTANALSQCHSTQQRTVNQVVAAWHSSLFLCHKYHTAPPVSFRFLRTLFLRILQFEKTGGTEILFYLSSVSFRRKDLTGRLLWTDRWRNCADLTPSFVKTLRINSIKKNCRDKNLSLSLRKWSCTGQYGNEVHITASCIGFTITKWISAICQAYCVETQNFASPQL